MPPILIDTNLLVYLYDTGSTGKAAQAWRVLDKLELTRMWLIFDLTSLIVLEAARGARDHGLPYYDAQIWAAAL
jgi:predicted nucleic acid-binding protein